MAETQQQRNTERQSDLPSASESEERPRILTPACTDLRLRTSARARDILRLDWHKPAMLSLCMRAFLAREHRKIGTILREEDWDAFLIEFHRVLREEYRKEDADSRLTVTRALHGALAECLCYAAVRDTLAWSRASTYDVSLYCNVPHANVSLVGDAYARMRAPVNARRVYSLRTGCNGRQCELVADDLSIVAEYDAAVLIGDTQILFIDATFSLSNARKKIRGVRRSRRKQSRTPVQDLAQRSDYAQWDPKTNRKARRYFAHQWKSHREGTDGNSDRDEENPYPFHRIREDIAASGIVADLLHMTIDDAAHAMNGTSLRQCAPHIHLMTVPELRRFLIKAVHAAGMTVVLDDRSYATFQKYMRESQRTSGEWQTVSPAHIDACVREWDAAHPLAVPHTRQ